MVDASDLQYRIFKFCRTTGTLISETVILEPGGKIAGYSHPNERSWAVENGNLVFKNGNGAITTVFDKWQQLGDRYQFLGRFLPGGDKHFHLLVEVAETGAPLSSERPVQLKCAGFDDLIRAGAEYYRPSRDTEPTINAAFGTIDDTSNDFVVLEDAVLTPNCGIAWNGLWICEDIQYAPASWRTANWLPGRFDVATNTLISDELRTEPKLVFEGPLFFVDTGVGNRNYGHFVHDSLPYGLLFKEAAERIPGMRPLIVPLRFRSQMDLFGAVFGIDPENCVNNLPDAPALVRQLVVARRQTDFVGERWRTSFAGLRHARDAATRSWARPWTAPPACSIAFEEQTTTVSDIQEAERISGPDLKVYLYRRPGTIPTEGLQVGRDFDNIDALGRLLLDNGFIAFDPGAVPLPEIVPLLQHAKQVVSVHGAGLANVLFCRPRTRVFEIRSPWGAWRSLEALSTVLGHDFTALQQSLPDEAEIPRIDLDELIALL